MQFSDIVGLLASGKVPTTDPVLAARQPVAEPQSFEQKGASAVLNQAVASPVSGRLQRLFGVTKLQIDPQILGGTFTPTSLGSFNAQGNVVNLTGTNLNNSTVTVQGKLAVNVHLVPGLLEDGDERAGALDLIERMIAVTGQRS